MTGKTYTDWKIASDVPPERRREIVDMIVEFMKTRPNLSDADRAFVSVLADHVADDPVGRPLTQAFEDVRTRGGVSPERRDILDKRDALIVGGWRRVPEWQRHPAHAAAGHISRAIRRYKAGRWKADRKAVTPPADLASAVMWNILKVTEDVPGTDGLYKILKSASA